MSIWKYKEIKESLGSKIENYITLEEGDTPLEKVSIQGKDILIKREDLNPTGSWKDRGTAFKLTKMIAEGHKSAVIPSSGNAAISLLEYIKKLSLNFTIYIVVSENVASNKKNKLLDLINGTQHKIYFDKKAKRKSSQLSAELGIPILRSSMDPEIVSGYWSLGYELANSIIHARTPILFVSVSSGTALVGLAQGLFSKIQDESKMPQIIVCQTESCYPIVESIHPKFDLEFSENSLADAIVDKSVLRLPQIEKIIKETNGDAVVVENQYIELAKQILEKQKLSYTSLLPIGAYLKNKEKYSQKDLYFIGSGR